MLARAMLLLLACTSRTVYFTALLAEEDTDAPTVRDIILDELALAGERVDVAMYTFTDTELATGLTDAVARGAVVRVCLDASQTSGTDGQGEVATALASGGADVRLASGAGGGILHHKFAIVDERTLLSGSFNWTPTANYQNDENLVVAVDPALAADYTAAFEELWSRAQ